MKQVIPFPFEPCMAIENAAITLYISRFFRTEFRESGKEFISSMLGKSVVTVIFTLATLLTGEPGGASCLTGTCHSALIATKYLHGPVAAEQAGAKGCVACHVPVGKSCSQNKKGSFKPLAPGMKMCQACHARGTGTQHSTKKIDCLKCHDPHGSDKNAALKR